MKKIVIIVLFIMIVFSFSIYASSPENLATWRDNRTKTKYYVHVVTREMIDVEEGWEEEFEAAVDLGYLDLNDDKKYEFAEKLIDIDEDTVLEMSDKLFRRPLIELEYEEAEKELLSKYSGESFKSNEIFELLRNFTLINFVGDRPIDFAIKNKNLARINEIVVIKEENDSKSYNTRNLEFITANMDWVDGNRLNLLPGNKSSFMYIIPKTEAEILIVELYSLVDNSYTTERVIINNFQQD